MSRQRGRAKRPSCTGRSNGAATLPPPLVARCRRADLVELLSREWLVSNGIGAYASSTVVGCNTRRYHGLLVAATAPPVGRMVALATVMEQLQVGDARYELATNEFPGVFSPRGLAHLSEFRNDIGPTFVFHAGGVELTKQLVLADSANTAAIRYTVRGGAAVLHLRPFVALRDYHRLRRRDRQPSLAFDRAPDGVVVRDLAPAGHALYVTVAGARFDPDAQWWYDFLYRADAARGQEASEDLYTPGTFECRLTDGQSCELQAGLDEPAPLDFGATWRARGDRLTELVASLGSPAEESTCRLAAAADAFLARREPLGDGPSSTILAGFPWFADWGRDAFLSLPGLLLVTRRFAKARQVFRTFASYASDGLIPNHFDDRSMRAHYNSIDASLWFIVAAARYLEATGDGDFWQDVLMPTSHAILSSYQEGTKFEIHADADGLLIGGTPELSLTWMDAAADQDPVTSRHGKAVEVNALWHSAHRIMAHYCAESNPALARDYLRRAKQIASAFTAAFWNERAQCLFDVVDEDLRDASIRPNQIFAVSLPFSPLPSEKQAAVVRLVTEKLLTPYGLRTLSPEDQRYQGRYAGSPEQRDRAYHQGTVWPFLIGPFLEAYLKVTPQVPLAVAQGRHWLLALEDHLTHAGLGFIGEVFDGDAPHRPGGCIAQAWSVAEVLRAKKLLEEHAQRAQGRRAGRSGNGKVGP